jgi:selenide,water dikinase
VPAVEDPRILVTALTRDDAAVFRTSDDRAIVATVDFFTPIVDDAYTFGSIAAANALSDLYAMGATPLFTLNLVAWPRDPELLELLAATVKGGVDKVREAGAFVLGGHSIDDKEPKFGMVALGDAPTEGIVTNAGARARDALVLTKPIGTGILSTGLKRELISEDDMAPAIESMAALNAGAMRAMHEVGVHAATDVTGFGLLGHLSTMLEASGVAARIFAGAVPIFEHARALAEQGAVPGGTVRNLEAVAAITRWGEGVSDTLKTLLCDAQTSGGLLMAVAGERLDGLLRALEENGTPAIAVVGEIIEGAEPTIEVTHAEA